ncbi:hypothetical protein KKHLCK_00015 [Candidatus Electrothrix laxa]
MNNTNDSLLSCLFYQITYKIKLLCISNLCVELKGGDMKKIILLLLLSIAMCSSNVIAQPAITKKDHDQHDRQAEGAKMMRKHLEKISDVANSTGSGDEKNIKGYVVSNQVATFSNIPKRIDNEIKELKKQARSLIRTVAIDIELSGGKSGPLTMDEKGDVHYVPPDSPLPEEFNSKRESLLTAQLNNNVSIRSGAMAIQLLVEINNSLKKQAAKAVPKEKEKIFMQQAVLVYEMADIALGLLNGLTLEGKEAITSLYHEIEGEIKKLNAEIETQIQEARKLQEQGVCSAEYADKEIKTNHLLQQANKHSLDVWKDVLVQMGTQEKYLHKLQEKKFFIKHIRNQAELQLKTLRVMRKAKELRRTIGNLDELVSSIGELDLLRLDEDTVRDLLGYGDNVKYDLNRD